MSKQILAVLAAFCFIGEEKGDAAQKGNNELRPLLFVQLFDRLQREWSDNLQTQLLAK